MRHPVTAERAAGVRSVVAIEDCLLAALTPTQFKSLIRSQPEVALELLRALVKIIRITDERLTEVSTLGTMARVCRELLRLASADKRTGAWLIAPLPTQRELAGRAGTTRGTVPGRSLSWPGRTSCSAPAGPCASLTGPAWKRRARALRARSRGRARLRHLGQMGEGGLEVGLGVALIGREP